MSWIKKFVQALVGAVLLIGLVIVLIGLFSSATGPRAASSTIDPHATPTLTLVNLYAPSKYGLPDTLAGYKVFAVLPAGTVACSRPGIKTLILQASQTSVEDFLKAVDRVALDAALHQAGLTADEVEIQVVGPGATLDVMLSEIQKWNQLMKNGCVQSGPVPLNQNRSTPPSTYDPAHYGLPPTIAGYKTFAVLTAENTACMPPGEKRLVLQATQANVQDFLSASSNAVIHQDLLQRGFADFAQGNVQIVGPGTTFDEFLSENEKWNEDRKKYGCVTSAPAVPLTPTQ